MKCIFLRILLVLGTACCQQLPEFLLTLKEKIDPFVSIEEVQNILSNKCKINGGDEAFNQLKARIDDLEEYVYSSFNITQITEEIDAVRLTQKFGIVFKKYCDKIPNFQLLVRGVFDGAEICVEEEEKPLLNILLNITETIGTTVCCNDGDRLSMFMEDGGPECILSQEDGVEQCVNETLSHYFPADFSYNKLLPLQTYDIDGCSGMVQLRTCVVNVLEKCDDISTAILIGALLSTIRQNLPCTKTI